MATVGLPESRVWGCSAGLYCFLIERVMSRFPIASAARQEMSRSIEHNIFSIGFDRFTDRDQELFADAVTEVLKDLRDPASFTDIAPDTRRAMEARISELVEVLKLR